MERLEGNAWNPIDDATPPNTLSIEGEVTKLDEGVVDIWVLGLSDHVNGYNNMYNNNTNSTMSGW